MASKAGIFILKAGIPETRLDETLVKTLESSLSPSAAALYKQLKIEKVIALHNATKDPQREPVKAYTRDFDDHYEIWLTPNHETLFDSFVHELGQVNAILLGYKALNQRGSNNAELELNIKLASFARNAFIFYVCESKLEKLGIDRSLMKQKTIKGFNQVLDAIPSINDPNHALLKDPFNLAKVAQMYISTRLFLGSDFDTLDQLWQEKIRYSNLKFKIRTIYSEASSQEITPERYIYLQRFFAQTLELGNIFV